MYPIGGKELNSSQQSFVDFYFRSQMNNAYFHIFKKKETEILLPCKNEIKLKNGIMSGEIYIILPVKKIVQAARIFKYL